MAHKLFFYQAQNALMQKQKGSIIAENKQAAQFELLSRGLTGVKLQQNWQLSNKPKNAEICALLNQLAMLLQSAIPLKNALQIVRDNCTQIALFTWLTHLLREIESGVAFSAALENQHQFLNFQEIQLIKVGEMTGKLAAVCANIAEHRSQSLTLQRKLQKILLYPMLVLGISFSLTLILLLFVVPQFAAMYGENAAKLPALTAVLLAMSEFLQNYSVFVFVLLGALMWALKLALKHSLWFNQRKQRLIALTPIFGKIIALSRLVNFTQSLQLMLQSGVPLNQALSSFLPQQQRWQKAQNVQGDVFLQQQVQAMLHWIAQGYAFSQSVSSELFPMDAQQMLQIGEKSGKLGAMLQHIATNYREKLNHQIDLLSQLFEPVLMLIIGGLIGIIMLGMYLPIFNMGSVIQ